MSDDTVQHGRIVTERRREALDKLRAWRDAHPDRGLSDRDLNEILNSLFPYP